MAVRRYRFEHLMWTGWPSTPMVVVNSCGQDYEFFQADRARLRALGDALPGPGPFTLFRGVAGRGAKRRVRGLSWTDDVTRARWFAQRHASRLGLPAVYRTVASHEDVFAFLNAREEREFVILPPRKVVRI